MIRVIGNLRPIPIISQKTCKCGSILEYADTDVIHDKYYDNRGSVEHNYIICPDCRQELEV